MNEISSPLAQLLELFSISKDQSFHKIVEETQEKWLRPQGKERWDIVPSKNNISKEELYVLFTELGMTKSITASKTYDYAIVLGATLHTVRNRFAFLKKEWERGIRFNQIVLLGSQRPIASKIEPNEEMLIPDDNLPFRKGWMFTQVFPETETEMMVMIFEQSDLPEEWRQLPLTVVDCSMRLKDGILVRPHTQDTYEDWLKTNPKPGSCLLISNQPYITRQDLLARQVLPESFTIHTIGAEVSKETFMAQNRAVDVFLDELARILYSNR